MLESVESGRETDGVWGGFELEDLGEGGEDELGFELGRRLEQALE